MEVVNRVAQSDVIVYDLELLWTPNEIKEFDIAQFLEQQILLREKSFRKKVGAYDWEEFRDVHVALYCSTEALVPMWAYMLISASLDHARSITMGRSEDIIREQYTLALEAEDWNQFMDRIVVVKGCGSGIVPESAYTKAMGMLQKVARKVMFGEPCSTVPIWRRSSLEPSPR